MIVDLAMATHTGITELMRIPILRLHEIFKAAQAIVEKRNRRDTA